MQHYKKAFLIGCLIWNIIPVQIILNFCPMPAGFHIPLGIRLVISIPSLAYWVWENWDKIKRFLALRRQAQQRYVRYAATRPMRLLKPIVLRLIAPSAKVKGRVVSEEDLK